VAKVSGLPYAVAVDDSGGTARTISNDITNLAHSTPRGVQDITGVDKLANERLLLLADYQLTLNGLVNTTATTGSHAVLRTVSSTSVARTVTLTIASQVLAVEAMFSDYALTRAQDGSLVFTAPAALADGAVPTWA
jgi:hypothetical protein